MASSGAPPSYAQATGSSTSTGAGKKPTRSGSNVPSEHRRSMEDEGRPLPRGWVRSYDPSNSHQFFVDTTVDPPRSIWHHPYDDEQYLSTLSKEERERIKGLHHQPTKNDIIAMDTDDEEHAESSYHGAAGELPPRPTKGGASGSGGFGRKLKDKLTGTTHEQRQAERREREKQEEDAYRQHLHIRRQMSLAEQTGQPQLLGKDPRTGQDVYITPSYGMPGQGYGAGGQYYNPYASGMYSNARFISPGNPYNRPYGYGYGGGMGLPLMGGLMGGALLGGLLF